MTATNEIVVVVRFVPPLAASSVLIDMTSSRKPFLVFIFFGTASPKEKKGEMSNLSQEDVKYYSNE